MSALKWWTAQEFVCCDLAMLKSSIHVHILPPTVLELFMSLYVSTMHFVQYDFVIPLALWAGYVEWETGSLITYKESGVVVRNGQNMKSKKKKKNKSCIEFKIRTKLAKLLLRHVQMLVAQYKVHNIKNMQRGETPTVDLH